MAPNTTTQVIDNFSVAYDAWNILDRIFQLQPRTARYD